MKKRTNLFITMIICLVTLLMVFALACPVAAPEECDECDDPADPLIGLTGAEVREVRLVSDGTDMYVVWTDAVDSTIRIAKYNAARAGSLHQETVIFPIDTTINIDHLGALSTGPGTILVAYEEVGQGMSVIEWDGTSQTVIEEDIDSTALAAWNGKLEFFGDANYQTLGWQTAGGYLVYERTNDTDDFVDISNGGFGLGGGNTARLAGDENNKFIVFGKDPGFALTVATWNGYAAGNGFTLGPDVVLTTTSTNAFETNCDYDGTNLFALTTLEWGGPPNGITISSWNGTDASMDTIVGGAEVWSSSSAKMRQNNVYSPMTGLVFVAFNDTVNQRAQIKMSLNNGAWSTISSNVAGNKTHEPQLLLMGTTLYCAVIAEMADVTYDLVIKEFAQ